MRVCATLGMGALVFGIINSADAGWGSTGDRRWRSRWGRCSWLALVANERRAEQPIMPLRLFRSRERSGAYAARMLYLGAMIGFFYFTTQYLQDVLGFTPLQAGLGFLPMTRRQLRGRAGGPAPQRADRQRHAARRRHRGHPPGMAWLSRLGSATPTSPVSRCRWC